MITLLPDSAVRIAAAGGGLKLYSSAYLPDSLVRIAAASRNNARIEIVVDAPMLPDTMVRIAAAGNGSVVFDITN